MKRVLTCALIVALMSALPGCSFLFVDGPPPDHAEREHFTCTTSRLGPIVDTVFAVTYGAQAAGVVATRGSNSSSSNESTLTLALFVLGFAGLFGASAYSGYVDTSDCGEAMDALEARRTLAPPTVLPTQPEPGAAIGCVSNEQCKIGRVCIQGTCVDPAPPVQVIVPVTPTPTTPTQLPPAPPPATPTPQPTPADQRPVLLFEGLPSQNQAPAPATP